MASFMVTGSSRGLGLALITRLASLPRTEVGTIIATARQDNSLLLKEIADNSSGRVKIVKLDVTNKTSVQEAATLVDQTLQGKGLDYLINNAGATDWTLSGLQGISTTLGSFALAPQYRLSLCPAYKISKAALNMLTLQYAQQYEGDGFTFLAISPGWLRTELGSSRADLPVETGAEKTMNLILGANCAQNGKFLNIHVPGWENAPGPNQYNGEEIAW
ncbi:Short-chain dehydrogenase/reductase SDR [Penicillium macrosclerotiorum]|uniref:Short-chain dehydrogenase/reductase SDR n=1 Tax=Penicillium macrosclerotiorum TaxID=303699 RepID=UPI002548945C|nr:Short-chain dehydrogenase/reductase SDR [Penicillium macrosclerotiorum]KAJ5691783.1 Short-chain dehydrogenase/reductase SDR [Penicillium macrosclerotiorum]